MIYKYYKYKGLAKSYLAIGIKKVHIFSRADKFYLTINKVMESNEEAGNLRNHWHFENLIYQN